MKRTTGFFLWLGTGISLIFSNGYAADLPTAMDVARQMGVAWNIANSLEVPKDPLAWGNPLPTKKLIDLANSSGFGTIRIPCAWDSHADQSTNIINASWRSQVKTIVDYCISDNMYVVLNSHWDGGWLEECITPFYYWGKDNLSTTDKERNTTWCDEAFVDSEFTICK